MSGALNLSNRIKGKYRRELVERLSHLETVRNGEHSQTELSALAAIYQTHNGSDTCGLSVCPKCVSV